MRKPGTAYNNLKKNVAFQEEVKEMGDSFLGIQNDDD